MVSLACGVGTQGLVAFHPEMISLPGLDTGAYGLPEEAGRWKEVCLGCGKCGIGATGGICVVTRCSKGLLNGPCGGSREGKCEVRPDLDCAWQLVWDRLQKLGREDLMDEIKPPKDWSHVLERRTPRDREGGRAICLRSSNLSRVLESGAFAVTAEITTPKGADLSSLAAARRAPARLRGRGECHRQPVGLRAPVGARPAPPSWCAWAWSRSSRSPAGTATASPCRATCWAPLPWERATCSASPATTSTSATRPRPRASLTWTRCS